MLKLVPFLLRQLQKGVGVLASSSETNPKKSVGLSILGGLLTLFGVAPSSLHAVGGVLVQIGILLKGF